MRAVLLMLVCLVGRVSAQYDIGLALGGSAPGYWQGKGGRHEFAKVTDIDVPGPVIAVFYRERIASHVDLGVECQYARRSFSIQYGGGSPAGSYRTSVDAALDLIHLSVTPEVRMDPAGNAVVRFGAMAGVLMGGQIHGERTSGGAVGFSKEELHGQQPADFIGDLRVLVGLGFRTSKRTWAVSLDPFVTYGITSLLRNDPGLKTMEAGLKVGVCRRVERKTLSQWLLAPDGWKL